MGHYNIQGIKMRVLLSEGDGTFIAATDKDQSLVPLYSYGSAEWARGLAEVNGDGRADLVVHYASSSNNGIKVQPLLSDGDGTVTASAEVTPVTSGRYGSANWVRGLGDVTGDGRADLVVHYASPSSPGITVQAFVSNRAAHGRLTALTNGLGATTTIAYTPSTQSSVLSHN